MHPLEEELEKESVFDKLHEECGVFALYGHPEAANLVYLGLYALQHRGQESAGIASSDGRENSQRPQTWGTSRISLLPTC